MSWIAYYCWREAFECERLARRHDGPARQEWLEAAEHWLDRSAEASRRPEPAAARRRVEAPVLSL
jgi:hypothetical protein